MESNKSKAPIIRLAFLIIILAFTYVTQGFANIFDEVARQDELFEQAEQGNAEAQNKLAIKYYRGDGVPQNCKKAYEWFQKAAEQGHADSQTWLGSLNFSGEKCSNILPYNVIESLKWYLRAANQGNKVAKFNCNGVIGLIFASAKDSEMLRKRAEIALEMLRMSAKDGGSFSQLKLGDQYYHGNSVLQQNYREAKKWYLKAAEQGEAEAQFFIGVMYYNGEGFIEPDYYRAAKWYQKAAEQGYDLAQYNLAICYLKGRGVIQNYIKAYALASVAATNGGKDAGRLRNHLEGTLSQRQIVQAQELSETLFERIQASSSPKAVNSKPKIKATGTGFLITRNGYILTCYHVIKGADSVRVRSHGETYQAQVIQADHHNDLALLRIKGSFPAFAFSNSRSAKLGESVFTIGFPNPDLQGLSAKLTKGVISGLRGCQDDPRLYQVSVPVQPGNSGGPLVDKYGEIVGIVVSSLDAKVTFKITGAIPQNVNYAVKGTYALAFLDSLPEVTSRLETGKRNKRKTIDGAVSYAKSCVVMVITY